ncbi:MAG: hypothetical protein OXG08_13150 [Gammaproteobacteria bacterium]|nr:hypothetical protein [Gammaproteobacteria bacterium]
MSLIWAHLLAAIVAAFVGIANLALVKGNRRHKIFGWIWIVTMLVVTLSSFGIRDLNDGKLSWLHGLTVWTLISMVIAIFAIRAGKVRLHAISMVGTMAGLLIAGAFAFAPGRFISNILGY